MKTWSDEDLAALVRDAFRDHESPDDPAEAHRLARELPEPSTRSGRRAWLAMVAAAAIVVAGGGVAIGVIRHPAMTATDPTSAAPAAGPASTDTAAAHRSLATAEAQRLLGWIDLNDAHAVPSAPSSNLDQPTSTPLASDAAHQIHTAKFWVIPVGDAAKIVSELTARTPPLKGIQPATSQSFQMGSNGAGSTAGATTIMWDGQDSVGTATDAYTGPEVDVAVLQDGKAVDLRADVWISWRPVRPASTYVGGAVSSVKVSYRQGGSGDPHKSGTALVTNPDQIVHLTAVVDNLRMLPPGGVMSCPAALGRAAQATMVFTSSTGVQTFKSATCPPSVEATAGKAAPASLEPGDFVTTVQNALTDR